VPIAEGGFGVVHRANHTQWGRVVYKELKISIIADGSKFVLAVIPLLNYICNYIFYHVDILSIVSTRSFIMSDTFDNRSMLIPF